MLVRTIMYSTDKPTAHKQTATLVAKNQCYELLYMPAKNRLYLSIFGFWKSRSAVSQYLSDLKEALTLVKPGFTLLLDLRTMITHPQSVMSLHIEALALLQEAGLKKGACVNPSDRIATLQVDDTIMQSHLASQRFTSYPEAEAWLEN